jgi:hypothetical protein
MRAPSRAEHGTIHIVPVILLLAAVAILGCVVLAALGMAGEMAAFPSDSAPLRLEAVTAADVALLRPPQALWGYNVPATEEALGVIARAVAARDTEIATLRQELADAQADWSARAPAPREHDDVPAWPAPPPSTSLDPAAPRSAGPGSAAPRSAGPGSAAPRSASPGSAAPRSASPGSAAPRSASLGPAAPPRPRPGE